MTIYQNGFFSSTLFVRSVQFPVFDYNATLSNTNLTENVYGPFTGTGAIQLRLSGLSRDIDLELWRDVDSNGTLDTAVDFLVASSRNTGTAEEVIQTSEQQPNSNVRYFAVIKAYDTIPANTVTGYTLNVSRIINTDAPSINPSNVNLSISGASKFSKSVETVEFNSSSSGRVNFRFSNNDVNALALFADSNNNGIFDQGDQLVKRASGTNSLTSDLGTGAYYLQLSGPTLASGAGNLLVTTDRPKNSDFNGDGKNDIVVQGEGWAGVWTMNGSTVTSWAGFVSTNGTSASTSGAKIVGVGDFNGDGKNDIVLQNQAAGWAGIWGMNGSTVTSWAGLPSTSGGNIVGVGDFNSDGKNDLVLQEAGWAGIWTMNGSSVTGWAGLPSTSGGRIVV